MEKLYSLEEMSEILDLNLNTLRIKIRAGDFKGYVFRTGRKYLIRESDLNLWIEKQKNKIE